MSCGLNKGYRLRSILIGASLMIGATSGSALALSQNTNAEHIAEHIIAIPPAVNKGTAWRVVKTSWDQEDERGYSAFVQGIGEADCLSMSDCLSSEANPYRDPDERIFYGDCADMVYTLRAYYAWKNGLPFSYQSAVVAKDGSGDTRYSSSGNKITARRAAIGAKPIHGPSYIAAIRGIVSTAMFRTHPDGGKNKGGGALYDDFYPVKISRESLRAGSVAYDIYGHVGLVYDITEDGRVLIVASHPDNSVTRTAYGQNFLRARPDLGAGLKAWRPVTLVGAVKNTDGSYAGGRIRGMANDKLDDYSLEQYIGTIPDPNGDWRKGEFSVYGRTVNFYDYVRRSLASPDFAYNPVDELRQGMDDVCRAIHDRRIAVRRAIVAGVHKREHPPILPPNIYGTYGDWENYSTPSRDARLKIAFIELRRAIETYVAQVRAGASTVRYDGEDLAQDLWDTYREQEQACFVIYRRTDDSRVRLNFTHIAERLFDLSFDPFHCPELRWGGRGVELDTCEDDATKRRWYDAQRFLRNQARRTYDVRMDFTLEQLKPPTIAAPEDGGLGVEAPADADLKAYLLDLLEGRR